MKAMQGLKADLLRGCWYVATTGSALKRGRMIAKTMLGEPVVVVRGEDGKVFALRNLCPHRGIPLSYGMVEGASVRCCYHGWRFDAKGACVEIPSLREGQQMDIGKIGCGAYPCVEQYGLVWVYFAADGEKPKDGPMPDVDIFPHIDKTMPPAAAISMGVVGRWMGCRRRMAPMTSTRIAMPARKTPLRSAPMISAR